MLHVLVHFLMSSIDVMLEFVSNEVEVELAIILLALQPPYLGALSEPVTVTFGNQFVNYFQTYQTPSLAQFWLFYRYFLRFNHNCSYLWIPFLYLTHLKGCNGSNLSISLHFA